MNRRIISGLTALTLVFAGAGALPESVFEGFSLTVTAAEVASGTCGENATWSLDSEGTLTISGTGDMADYEYGKSPWYANREDIKKVVIENGITSIGGYAFDGCSSLTSIDIPNSVTSIGEGAFYACSALSSVIIPNSVTSIGDSAFACCLALTSVNIPNSITSINDCVFAKCSSLTSVIIPDSVTSIGECAFAECSSLTSVTIPKSVTQLGNLSFGYYYDYENYSTKKYDDFTIKGYKNTAAETYAAENEITFIALDEEIKYGDINGDGTVSGVDVGLIMKHMTGWDIPNWNDTVADVNADGNVDGRDVSKIQKKMLGWDVVLGQPD